MKRHSCMTHMIVDDEVVDDKVVDDEVVDDEVVGDEIIGDQIDSFEMPAPYETDDFSMVAVRRGLKMKSFNLNWFSADGPLSNMTMEMTWI